MRLKLLRLIAAIGCLLIFSGTSVAQSFSFNCSRDTVIAGCSAAPCFKLKSIIPDLHGLANSYTINPSSTVPGCAPVYVQPNDPFGTPTNLSIDDRYSSVVNIGFPFPFYGTIYNSLIVSTNGVVSFDISKANASAHFIVNANLPSAAYDRALIMGPYHDLDPSIGSSPTQRIQYQGFGTAPHRRWVLSFYRVPLYSTSGACNSLIENTHQIVLYESTGIIEVTVFSKQICAVWQAGKAIVGLQDFTKTQGIMAPNRAASDPAWGFVGMNESWRFVPAGGPSLFKRVELYDIGGTLITTGTVIPLGNGTMEASFPNICPPAGATTSYIVRSVYEKIDDPAIEISGSDTIRVTKGPPADLNATASATPTACGPPSGSISVTVPTGTPPFTYVLDSGIPQTGLSSYTFNNVASGSHTVVVTDASGVCNSTVLVNVSQSNNLSANITPNTTSCPGVNNGSIFVGPFNGTAPYTFVLNPGNITQTGATASYTGLAAGAYSVSITDASGCTTIPALNTTVAAGAGLSANTLPVATTCAGAVNGRITLNPTNGTGPFTFVLDGTTTQTGAATTTFTGLTSGNHSIAITDANGCTNNPPITVNIASGAILAAIPTETATSCAGASNGTVLVSPVNGTAPYTFVLDGTITQAGATTTFINLSAGLHSVIVTDASGCISNSVPVNIIAGPVLTTTASYADVLCNGGSTGSINVAIPTIGTAPYQYSLNNINWQNSNIFPGLIAGSYTVYYRESNGCQNFLTVTVAEPTALAATTSTVPVVCNGQSNGIITVNTGGGVAPYEYSINNGTNWQSNNIFNRPAGLYTITIRDNNNCITTQQVTVTEPAALIASSLNTNASCDGGNDGVIKINALGGNSNYQYSLDGTTFQASDIFNVAPGVYDITIKDNLGCSYVMNTTVGLTNNLTYTPQTNPTICESKSVQLQLISNATQYSWAPATGLSSTTIANPIANPTVTTRYTVTATLGRCNAADIVTVNVNAAPIPDAGPPGFICYGQTYQLQGSGGVSYTWTPSTYLNSTAIVNPVSNPAKTITYTLSNIIDANGCASLTTDTVTVDVTPPIKVKTFPYDTIAYPGDKFQLLATSGANIYSWTPAAGLSDPNIPDPVVTIGQIGDDVLYQVIASTIAGCKGEGYVRLKVYKGPDIYVPTGFTPNGDGKNDKFIPFPVGIKGMNYFRVFNRWGQIIFSTSNLYDGWDGRINGIEQSTGTYVWTLQGLTLDNRVITKKGTVTLIR